MIKYYKLRHKATGLFYRPVKGYDKLHLTKTGKTYTIKPRFEWVEAIHTAEDVKLNPYNPSYTKTQKEDWEIVEYIVVEDKIYGFE